MIAVCLARWSSSNVCSLPPICQDRAGGFPALVEAVWPEVMISLGRFHRTLFS